VRREHLTPGNYRFQNLPVANGANNVEIIMRDSFGNESRNSTHFYLTDQLLKAGLHNYLTTLVTCVEISAAPAITTASRLR